MEHAVYISQLGDVARTRGVSIAELQRRLRRRGLSVSRGALDRLFSERPVREVSLDIVMPVLEELDLDFRSAFRRVTPAQATELRAAREEAGRLAARFPAARGLPRDKEKSEASLNELAEVGDRLEAELRRTHPELFDARGRLRRRALTRLLAQQAEKRLLAGTDLAELSSTFASPQRSLDG